MEFTIPDYKVIVPGLTTMVYFALAILIFTKGRGKDAIVLNYSVISIGLWSLGLTVFYTTEDPVFALYCTHFLHTFGALISTSFLFLSYIYPHKEFTISIRKRILILIPNFILFVLLFFTHWMVTEVRDVNGVKGFIRGPGFVLWMAVFNVYFLWAFIRLFKLYHQFTGIVKVRLKIMIAGALSGLILGGTANVTMPHIFNHFELLWLGPTLSLPWFFCLTYAILRYQLMDIQIIIKKSIVYSILLTIVSGLYFMSVIIFERYFQNVVGYQSALFSIFTIVVIAMLFAPLKSRIQDFVDKTFFKKTALEMAQENELLRQEITQSERYKTLASLTGGIVDEIKNPLTTLVGYSHFFDQRLDDKEFLTKFSGVLKKELSKINELTQHLTDYSNPAPISTQKTDMAKLLNETIGLLKSNLMEHKIELTKSFKAPEGTQLLIDASQIRQAVSNIVMNAIEAMSNGGALVVATEMDEERYRIRVRDVGPGIPREELSRIFDPFFTTKKQHTGLGLSIAQGIIQNHNGKLRVKSEEEKGTEFVIELPLEFVPGG